MITNSTIGGYGRMGNQLFQYAFLLGQCHRAGRQAFINGDRHGFDLRGFRLMEEEGPVKVVGHAEYLELFAREVVAEWRERVFQYSPELAWGADGCDYIGYFQCPLYFEECADAVRPLLQVRVGAPESVTRWEAFIGRSAHPVVGIHVRMGDYLIQPSHHPNLHLSDYYERAIDAMRAAIGGHFTSLVFSDDIRWCQSSSVFRQLDDVHFVSGNAGIWDLHLLTRCSHHIVANSSFSWWGAWLAAHDNQVVFAPKQWFGPAYDLDWSMIYPPAWTRLDSYPIAR